MLCEDTRRTKICAFGRNDRFSAGDMQCKSLDETVCAGYRNTEPDIVYEAYLWYLVKSRGTPFVLLLAAAGTRYRKTAVMLTVVWLGFCFGMVICMAIIKLGSKGIVLIVTALAPQGIFYAMAGIVLFRYMLEYPMVRWDAGRSIRLGLFLMLGIITECYVNPVLTGLFLKTL